MGKNIFKIFYIFSYTCLKSKLKELRGHKVAPVMSHKFDLLLCQVNSETFFVQFNPELRSYQKNFKSVVLTIFQWVLFYLLIFLLFFVNVHNLNSWYKLYRQKIYKGIHQNKYKHKKQNHDIIRSCIQN